MCVFVASEQVQYKTCGLQPCSFSFYTLLMGWMCLQRNLFSALGPHTEETAYWYLFNVVSKPLWPLWLCPKGTFLPKEWKIRFVLSVEKNSQLQTYFRLLPSPRNENSIIPTHEKRRKGMQGFSCKQLPSLPKMKYYHSCSLVYLQ